MNVVVVGPGAVGSLLGGLLAVAGHHVALLGRTRDPGGGRRREADLLIRRPGGASDTVAVTRFVDPVELPPDIDLFVLAVRQMDLAAALDTIAPWPATPTVTVQNGIGAEDLAALRRPAAPLVAASLTAPVDLIGPAEVRWLSRGGIALASVRGQVALARSLEADFRAVGLPSAICRDPISMKWSKLLANLVGNATGAILDMDVAAIYRDAGLFQVERTQLLEALEVLRGLKRRPVTLPGARVPFLALAATLPSAIGRPILSRVVGGVRGGKLPSLRAHVRTGHGPSEVAWLNGAVARTAETLQLAAPVNAALARLVDEAVLDEERRAWYRERPDRLLAAVRAA